MYIDQFGVSEMMKSLNPRIPAERVARVDTRWREVFRRLDRLVKLQLIVCPESEFHRHESAVSKFDDALKQMIRLLSGGVEFHHSSWIESLQIQRHVRKWIEGQPDAMPKLDVDEVLTGDRHGWTDRFILSVDLGGSADWADDLRTQRDQTHKMVAEIFDGWRAEGRSFSNVFTKEIAGYGQGLMHLYDAYAVRIACVAAGLELPSLELMPPPAVGTIHSIHELLRGAGISKDQLRDKTVEYLASESLRFVPFLKIRAMLYAAVARKASAGQKCPPNRGLVSDVSMVSVLLPYCDAILVDNAVAGYLMEQPLATELDDGAKVFSPNTLDEMLEYLGAIEARVPVDHIEMVRKVYGAGWEEPFETMYDLGE